jgi:hypothetical protein
LFLFYESWSATDYSPIYELRIEKRQELEESRTKEKDGKNNERESEAGRGGSS